MDWYADTLLELEKKDNPSEAEVRAHLINPVLRDVLGFGIGEIDMEPFAGLQPDYVCTRSGSSSADVIVEAKRLRTDLLRRTSQSFSSCPAGQIRRYLNDYPAADEGTWGVVTNGSKWIILQRREGRVPPTAIGEPVEARSLDRVSKLLSPVRERGRFGGESQADFTADWLSVAAKCADSSQFVQEIAPEAEKIGGGHCYVCANGPMSSSTRRVVP